MYTFLSNLICFFFFFLILFFFFFNFYFVNKIFNTLF
ncbi:phosphatidylglycerophosphatase A, partial [Streptococcus agalactiae]